MRPKGKQKSFKREGDNKRFFVFLSGLILRLPFLCQQVPSEHLFDDELCWEVPEEDEEAHHNKSTGSSEPMFQQQRKTVDDSQL